MTLAGAAEAACRDDRVDLRGDGGQSRFTVEIADTPDTRARGLMFREELATSAGMLFIFEPPREVAFWMRNTPLPLDLIFLDTRGAVIRVTENAVPFSDDRLPSGGEVRAVLEINAGLADRFGIAEGDQMRHPAFADGAPLWPC